MASLMAHSTTLVTSQIKAHKEPACQGELIVGNWLFIFVQQRAFGVERSQVFIRQFGPAHRKTKLVESEVLANHDGKGERDYLQPERAIVASIDLIEPVRLICDHAGENINSASGTLRVGSSTDLSRQREFLLESDQVRRTGLKYLAFATQVEFVEDEALRLPFDGLRSWQEAASNAKSALSKPQVQTCRLDVAGWDGPRAGVDDASVDDLLKVLSGEDALATRKGQHGRRVRRDNMIHPTEIMRRAGVFSLASAPSTSRATPARARAACPRSPRPGRACGPMAACPRRCRRSAG